MIKTIKYINVSVLIYAWIQNKEKHKNNPKSILITHETRWLYIISYLHVS